VLHKQIFALAFGLVVLDSLSEELFLKVDVCGLTPLSKEEYDTQSAGSLIRWVSAIHLSRRSCESVVKETQKTNK